MKYDLQNKEIILIKKKIKKNVRTITKKNYLSIFQGLNSVIYYRIILNL